MEKNIRLKQSKTVGCSLLYSLLLTFGLSIVLGFSSFFRIIGIDFFIVIPLFLAVLLLPLQALFFDIFNARNRYFLFYDNEFVQINETNKIFDDIEKSKFLYNDIANIKFRFKGMKCLETLVLSFHNQKTLNLMSFYFSSDDYLWMKEFLTEKCERDQ